MAENMIPKDGTEVSIKWMKDGPLFSVCGTTFDIALSFAVLAGNIAKVTGIPIERLTQSAREAGAGLYDAISEGSVTVDLTEARRQAAQMKEDQECASES